MYFDFLNDRNGNFSVVLSLSMMVLLAGAGMAIDVTNQQRTKSDLQNSVDAATMAGATLAFAGKSEALVKEEVRRTFKENCDKKICNVENLNINLTSSAIEVDTIQSSSTFFMSIFGKKELEVPAKASVNIGGTQSIDVYMLLDNTASMNIVDGPAAIEKFKKLYYPYRDTGFEPDTQCAFACHLPESDGSPVTFGGKTGAEIARENNIPMREDRIRAEMIDQAKLLLKASPTIRISVNSFTTKLVQHGALSSNFGKVKGAIESIQNASERTHYASLGADLNKIMAPAGGTATKKVIVMITDGAQQNISAHWPELIEMSSCDALKAGGHELYVLNIAYPDPYKIAGHQFDGSPEFEMAKLRPKIEPQLTKCASKPEYYFSADYGKTIDKALESITKSIISNGKSLPYFSY